jgi:hypothetical protein
MRPAALVAVIFLGLVALLHIIRLALQVEVVVGGVSIPAWPSVFAVLGPGALAIWLWRERRASG